MNFLSILLEAAGAALEKFLSLALAYWQGARGARNDSLQQALKAQKKYAELQNDSDRGRDVVDRLRDNEF